MVPHCATERHLERLAAADPGFAYTSLRAAFVARNLSTTHGADVRDLGEVLVPAGGGRTAFLGARDVAAAAARVLAGATGAPAAPIAFEQFARDSAGA